MKQLFLFITILVLNGFLSEKACAQEVSVILTTDESFSNRAIIDKMQRNLSQVLTEINRAQKENRLLNTVGLALDDFADRSLHMLWANIHFYCDDEEVVERCWVFGDGEEYMVSHIPLIIQMEGEEFGNGTYQEAVVDFDRQGRIKDFRFSLDAQLGESMEHCGVAEVEKRMKIRAYCERLQTAYNQKDIDFINQIFSDDASVIELGKTYLGIIGFFYIMPALTNGLQGYFRGIGDLRVTMWSSFMNIGVRVVAAAVLVWGFGFGIGSIAVASFIGWIAMFMYELPILIKTAKRHAYEK